MKILLTGASGYIGKRLLPGLLTEGHEVVCSVRDKSRFDTSAYDKSKLSVIEADYLREETLSSVPEDIDAAYYLIHSMSGTSDFEKLEKQSALNFVERINKTKAKQVIYLSGIVNEEKLSKHLSSRKAVEEILSNGDFALTTLRAGIIVGSGSASFEIIRDLVEKLPIMVAPRWLNTKTQPIAVSNVIQYLKGVLFYDYAMGKSFDIGGPEVLNYKQMLLRFAKVRNLKRRIFVIPVMTPRLSSYWLYFVTSTSYKLAVNLVNSMKIEIIGNKNDLSERLDIKLIHYDDAVRKAFEKIEHQEIISSWTDALPQDYLPKGFSGLVKVPQYGCFSDKKVRKILDSDKTMNKVWSIGGKNGWYYADFLWSFRGFLDKLIGGVGLNRGRKNSAEINAGDSLDFWRVLYANKDEKRLLLYAEMKLPGEAWLEFNISDNNISQTATFRPLGLWGRIYWYLMLPFHFFIFRGMINKLAKA